MTATTKSVVLLTRQNSTYGGQVLERTLSEGVPVACVVIQRWGRREKLQRLGLLMRKHGVLSVFFSRVFEVLDRWILSKRRPASTVEALARAHSIPTKSVIGLNSDAMVKTLGELGPDLILLAGVGVIRKEVIHCARLGVLNGHPGLVPRYRGNYVVRWALHDGAPVGVTVHLVDAGIDTGDVLLQEEIDLPKVLSLRDLEDLADAERALRLARMASQFIAGQAASVPQVHPRETRVLSYMPLGKLIRTYRRLWRRTRNDG